MARKLVDVDVRLISFVRRGANNKKFTLFKSADGEPIGEDAEGTVTVDADEFMEWMQESFNGFIAKRVGGGTPGDGEQEDDMAMSPELKEALADIRNDLAEVTALSKSIASGEGSDVLESVTDDTTTEAVAAYLAASLEGFQEDVDSEKQEKARKTKGERLAEVRAKLLDALKSVPKEHRKARHPRMKDDKDKADKAAAKAVQAVKDAEKVLEDAKKAVPSQGAPPNVTAGAGRHADATATGDASDAIDSSVGAENEAAIAEALKEMKLELASQRKELETIKAKPGSSHAPSTDGAGAEVEKDESDAYVDPDDAPVADGWSSDMAASNYEVVKKMDPLVDNGFMIVKKKVS